MSHSVSRSQKYVDLYQLRQAAIAGTLHSNLAQPIVAAKNFAAAIMDIQGDDSNLQEARELAGVILDMTNQAYTVTYDLMRETESDATIDVGGSLQSSIENYGALLRLNARGIKLEVYAELASVSIDRFVHAVLLDWIKAMLIYLARQTNATAVGVKIVCDEPGLCLEVTPDVGLSSEQLEAEIALMNIDKQLQVLEGTLLISGSNEPACVRIVIPVGDMITVTK